MFVAVIGVKLSRNVLFIKRSKRWFNSEAITRRPIIGILGGVGPMAGILFHKQIVKQSNASTDQKHLDVVHLSLSQYVGDRTEYLMDRNRCKTENPALGMAEIAKSLSRSAIQLERNCVIGVICNTFHSPLIYNQFTSKIAEHNKEICRKNNITYTKDLDEQTNLMIPGYLHCNNMIKLTLKHIINDLGLERVGLMSTTGTRQTNLYPNVANSIPKNINIIEVDDDDQHELHDSIYNQYDGIKKLSVASNRVRNNFKRYLMQLKEKGVEAVILGCTEIPIVLPEDELFGIKLIDPMNILAHKMIEQVQKRGINYKRYRR